MQVDVTSKSVREMAGRMAATHEIRKDKALELLACAFGFRNFDTLSGVLQKQRTNSVQFPRPVLPRNPADLWLEMFSCSEWGEAPRWARTTLTPARIEALYALREECAAQELAHVSVWQAPEDWDEDAGHGSAFNMRNWQLYVSRDSFWYRGVPKHASIAAETRAVRFSDLEDVLAGKTGCAAPAFIWLGDMLVQDASDARAFFEDVFALRLEKAGADSVAEWVGLHYKVNFEAESLEKQHDWLERYLEANPE